MDPTDTAEHGISPEIEAEMAADEKAWAEEERHESSGRRDGKGRFTSAEQEESEADEAELTDAQRAGDDAVEGEGKGSTEAKPSAEQKPAQEQQTPQDKQKPEDTALDQRSRWAKENERKSKTWETINQTKAQLEQEREQFRLEREQFDAQQKTVKTVERDAQGYTAADYSAFVKTATGKAATLAQQAMVAEQRGDFAEADALHAQAGQQTEMAKRAEERAAAIQGANGPSSIWARLATDLPDALKFDSPINSELRKILRGNQQLLADPIGPYRAAVQVGRKVLESTQAELVKSKAEAAKVPELMKQVGELTKKVKELTELTSLQGDGAPLSRGNAGGKSFGEMSLEEMEADIESTILQR